MTDKWFATKVAVLNGGSFALCVSCITYVDARLTTHVAFQARIYPYGYLVAALGGMFVLATTYVTLSKMSSWSMKTVIPSCIVLLTGAVSIPFFKPELPHGGLLLWTGLISIVSLLTCFIRLSPVSAEWLNSPDISESAQIERVKECANLWRMIAVSSVFGTVALVVPWTGLVWQMPTYIATNPDEAFLLGQFDAGRVCLICIYIFFGVIYESFHKAKTAADLLLLIKTTKKN